MPAEKNSRKQTMNKGARVTMVSRPLRKMRYAAITAMTMFMKENRLCRMSIRVDAHGDRIIIETTAYEGRLYARVKTEASRSAVPVPEDIRPFIEAWKRSCPDTSPEALMFPTFGRGERTGKRVPRHAKNFLKWRIYPITDKLGNPTKAGHVSGDAADAGNRSTRARHHEGCANSATARKHQDNRQRLHATDSGQCGGGVELTDEGSFVEKAAGFRKDF